MPPNPTSLTVTDALVQTGNPIRDRQFFNTQINVLHSRALAERVVDEAQARGPAAFQGPRPTPSGRSWPRSASSPSPRPSWSRSRSPHNDPKDAALWANTLADVYIDYSIEGQVEAAQARLQVGERAPGRDPDRHAGGAGQAAEELPGTGPVRARGQRLGDHHLDHQAQRGPHPGPGPRASSSRRSSESSRRCAGAAATPTRSRRWRRRGRWPRPERQASRRCTLDLLAAEGEVQGGPPRGAEGPGADAAAAHGPRRARRPQIEDGLRAEYRQLQRKESELKAAIDDQKGRAADQSLKMTELESLKKQADSAAGLYTVLLQKLNETNIAASIQNNNVRLLDRAVVPTAPVWPRKRQAGARGPAGRAAAGRGLRAAARLSRQHDQGRRRRRALPAPRAAGRDPPLRTRTTPRSRPRPTRTCAPRSSSRAAATGARSCWSPAPRPARARRRRC